MAEIIVLTGTPGAGKTTVLDKAIDLVDSDVSVINYADVMLETGKDSGLGSDHDKIRKLKVEQQIKLQKKAAENIAKKAEGITVVDTHSTIKTKNGYLPGLPEWVVKALKPKTIVLVEAGAEEIIGRRNTDESRERDKEDADKIELHQKINRSAVSASAVLTGATIKIVENHDNKLKEAAENLAEILK
ncbi:MAG: adenylate kinase [Candidatus Undinarchaeales archaeon]